MGLDLLGQVDPAPVGQLVVHDDDRRLVEQDELHRLVDASRRDRLYLVETEHVDQGLADFFVVVDQQDDLAGLMPRSLRAR